MESSGPGDGERRARRTGVLIGFLAALVIGLGVALAFAVGGGDGKKDEPVTTPTSATTQATVTTEKTVTTSPPTTTTTTPPAGATITQVQAKAAAQRGATAAAAKFGIAIPPADWDARCTAAGGTDQAATWSCQVASGSGQCSGSITAYARAAGVAATRDPQVGCGE